MTCGLYLITDPERQVEIEVTHIDVSCDEGGLISVSSPLSAFFYIAHFPALVLARVT